MLVHVKRTRPYRIGQRARVERRCSAKITEIDVQIEPGRLVLLVRWGFASAVALLRRRTADDGGRASDQLAWGTERETPRSRMLILQMRDLCLVSASLISFLPMTVHQVAVICRFALLGGTHKKKEAADKREKKSRPFGRIFAIAPEHATTGTPPERPGHSGPKSKPNSGPNGEFASLGVCELTTPIGMNYTSLNRHYTPPDKEFFLGDMGTCLTKKVVGVFVSLIYKPDSKWHFFK